MSEDSEQTDVSIDDEIAALIDGAESTEEVTETPEVDETDTQEAAPEATEEPTAEEVQEAIEALTPPDRWNSKFKDAFSALDQLQGIEGLPEGFDPRAIQQAWLDYHTDRQAYITPLEQERAQYAKALAEFQEVLAPYEQTWQMAGLTPAQGVRQLMGWAGAIQQNPQKAIERLAQTVGIDFAELAAAKAKENEWQDPQVVTLQKQVEQLTGHLRSLQQETLQSTQSARNAAIEQQIAAFRDAQDEHGNPLHPHFADLEPLMYQEYMGAIQALQNGVIQQMPTLEELYESAAWKHPDVRAARLKAQQEQEAARDQDKAQRAATASRSVKSKGAGKDSAPAKSIEEEVGELYDQQAA